LAAPRFFGGDDRGVGLGEQGVEGTLEEVFLDGGDVFPFGLGFLEDLFEQVLPCPHDEVCISLGGGGMRILRWEVDLVGGWYHVEERGGGGGLDAAVWPNPDGCERAADDFAVAVGDVTGEETQHGGLVDVRVEEDSPFPDFGCSAFDHVLDEGIEQRVAGTAQFGRWQGRLIVADTRTGGDGLVKGEALVLGGYLAEPRSGAAAGDQNIRGTVNPPGARVEPLGDLPSGIGEGVGEEPARG
jgi:hypothetical protein